MLCPVKYVNKQAYQLGEHYYGDVFFQGFTYIRSL